MKKILYFIWIVLLINVLIGCKQVQPVEDAVLTLSQQDLHFGGYAATLSVKVDANREWRAISSDWWIAVTPNWYPSAGKHFIANVAVSVSDNEQPVPRDGSVDFYINDNLVATLTILQDTLSEQDRPDEEFPITWANLQWKTSGVIAEGKLFEAGCCVYADGITNVLDSETGEDITCDIGYCTQNTRPDGEDWIWFPISFWEDWGNNFYYQGYIQDTLPVGTYYYTFRARNGKGPYKYAGTDGLWDGEVNLSGQFEVQRTTEPDEGPDLSGFTIAWANIQWTSRTTFDVTDSLNAGSKVYIPGLTDVMTSLTGEGVYCEMGYGTTSDPHNTDWIWRPCPFSADWGQEFYFQGYSQGIQEPGTYYYTFRYSLDRKQTYVYAGADGLWEAITQPCKTFVVK